MYRRAFISLIGSAAVAPPLTALAQQATPVIGFLSTRSAAFRRAAASAYGSRHHGTVAARCPRQGAHQGVPPRHGCGWQWRRLLRRSEFSETLAKKTYYGPVYMRRDSEPYMTLGMAGTRYDAGVSIVELNLKPMWDIVQQTKVGDHGVAYVVNSEGRIIAHPDFGMAKSLRDVSSLAQVQEARATPPTGSVRVARDMNNQDVAVVYARVRGPGWTVFVELPVQEWTKN